MNRSLTAALTAPAAALGHRGVAGLLKTAGWGVSAAFAALATLNPKAVRCCPAL